MSSIIQETALTHPYFYLFLFSFLLSIGLSYITTTQSQNNNKYTTYFVIFTCTNGLWALLLSLKLILTPTVMVQIAIDLLIYISFPYIGILWLMFVYYYTNIQIEEKYIFSLLVPFTGLVIASAYTIITKWNTVNIFFETNGVTFIELPYESFLVLQILAFSTLFIAFVGTVLLITSARKQSNINRKQYYLLILSGIILLGGASISLLRFHPYPTLQIYPAIFSLFVVVIWKAIYGYDFFTVIPVARTKIIETLPQGIIVVDAHEKIIDTNKSAEHITGKTSDELYKKNIFDIFDRLECKIESVKEETQINHYTIETENGTAYYQVTTTPFYNNIGEYSGTSFSFKDVTKLKEQKNLLEDRQEELQMQKHDLEDKTIELERQNEQLEQFASVLSHDLRNPLNVAEGYAELVKENPENDTYYENLKTGLRRMDEMIEDLLTLTRQGKTVKSTETVDLEEQVNDSWGMLELTDANLTVVETMEFAADKKRLKNVFENLFRNSEDHSPDGKTVEIEVGLLDDSNGFYIEDNGPGVPDDHKEDIFKHGQTFSDDGTGLGLSIVHQICEAHGWNITIEDGESIGGARFEIFIDR